MTSQSTWRRAYAGAKLTVGAAVVAGLMAFSAPAQAVTFQSNLGAAETGTGAPVVDLLAGPYSWTAFFTESDIAGVFTFNFLNTHAFKVALALKSTTINQLGTSFFEGGVTTTFDGVATFTPQGSLASFAQNAFVDPGDTVSLVYDFGNPRGTDTSGPFINFLVEASVVPLPAALVLFLSGLAGIGFLGRYNAKRRREPELA